MEDVMKTISIYRLNIERRTRDIAFIHGRIDFMDASSLDFKEFIEKTERGIEKSKYGYNYRRAPLYCSNMTTHLIPKQGI